MSDPEEPVRRHVPPEEHGGYEGVLDDLLSRGGFLEDGPGQGEIWDVDALRRLIGRTLLIALVAVTGSEQVVARRQLTAIVDDVHPTRGVRALVQPADSIFWLPGDPEAFIQARPGTYQLRPSGTTVTNPDFLTTWRIYLADVVRG